MISAFLDSFVFACPNDPTERDVMAFVTSLLEWRDVERQRWMRTFVSTQVAVCVAEAGCGFPLGQVSATQFCDSSCPSAHET